MAAKQEVTAEEELTVKTQARAPSAGVVLQIRTGALLHPSATLYRVSYRVNLLSW